MDGLQYNTGGHIEVRKINQETEIYAFNSGDVFFSFPVCYEPFIHHRGDTTNRLTCHKLLQHRDRQTQ